MPTMVMSIMSIRIGNVYHGNVKSWHTVEVMPTMAMSIMSIPMSNVYNDNDNHVDTYRQCLSW